MVTGVLNFDEVDLEGRFLCLKNSSDKDQCLGNWGIERQVLEGEDIAHKFKHKYVLKGIQRVTVWAAGTQSSSTLVWKSQSNWGSGRTSALSWSRR